MREGGSTPRLSVTEGQLLEETRADVVLPAHHTPDSDACTSDGRCGAVVGMPEEPVDDPHVDFRTLSRPLLT